MPDVSQLRFWVENYLSKQDVFITTPVNPAIHKLLQALKATKPQFFADIADILKELSVSFAALQTLKVLLEPSVRNLEPVKPEQQRLTFTVIAEYLLYIEVIKAIQDKTKLRELLEAGFPREVMGEILQMYPQQRCEPDYIELLRLAILHGNAKKIQMILAKKPFANIKMLKDIDRSDIDQIAQYRDLQDVLKEANSLEIIVALIRGGFYLPLLTEILSNYPETGGRILLNLLCNRTSIIGGAFYFNKEFAQKDIFLGFEPVIFLVGLMIALKFCAGAYCKINLTLLCNYNVLAAREVEIFENSLKTLFSIHDCEDENCINHPSRLKHLTLILICLARFPLSYSISEELVENNSFIIYSALLGFSFAYSIFILPLAQAALVNEMLDSQQQSYDKARHELADILKQQKAVIPAAPVLFRNLSLQSLASVARDISESGASRDSKFETGLASPQPY